jgi:hypothetical protein
MHNCEGLGHRRGREKQALTQRIYIVKVSPIFEYRVHSRLSYFAFDTFIAVMHEIFIQRATLQKSSASSSSKAFFSGHR